MNNLTEPLKIKGVPDIRDALFLFAMRKITIKHLEEVQLLLESSQLMLKSKEVEFGRIYLSYSNLSLIEHLKLIGD